jgi:hypothetical protein
MADLKQLVKDLIHDLVKCMAERDICATASRCALPYVVYILDEILVAHTSGVLEQMIRLRFDTAMTHDVHRVDAKIIEIEETGDGRATCVLQWDFLRADDSVVTSNLVRYMVSQRQAQAPLRVEIAEYLWVSDAPLAQYVVERLRAREPAWLRMH